MVPGDVTIHPLLAQAMVDGTVAQLEELNEQARDYVYRRMHAAIFAGVMILVFALTAALLLSPELRQVLRAWMTAGM